MTVKPLSPKDAKKAHGVSIPDVVFEVFNKLLAERYSDGSVVIYQPEVVKLLVAEGVDRSEMFDKGWLDVEDHYRRAGWKVEYDKPGYCESYEANWTFIKK